MKRSLCLILILCAMCSLLYACKGKGDDVTTTAEPVTVTSGDYSYTVLEDGTAKITKYNSPREVLVLEIPEELDGHKVSIIGSNSFAGLSNFNVIYTPSGVKTIEKDAFKGSSIKKAFLYKSALESIDEAAFYECHSLIQVDMPASLSNIGKNAFYYCENLNIAFFRGDVKNIDALAFNASNKVKLYIHESYAHISLFGKEHSIPLEISSTGSTTAA